MKRAAIPLLTSNSHQLLEAYTAYLREHQDLATATRRNYVSDVRQFLAWGARGDPADDPPSESFRLDQVTTATVTRYRSYLQTDRLLKATTINRYLISLKQFFGWATLEKQLARDPAQVVKLLPEETTPPRHLTDAEEDALVAAVTTAGTLRDRTLIVVMLHTGLRAGEICQLRRSQVMLQKRSGSLQVQGKRQKVREVPLNTTAREVLRDYLSRLAPESVYVFPSERTGQALTERALGHLIAKYVRRAQIPNLRPHDLRHRFGYRMAQRVPLHRLAQIMGHDSLDTTLLYVRGTSQEIQAEVEKIAWT
jgi:integrase/recombinase XerC